MNKSHLLFLGLILFFSMSSCEKDDLCIPEEAATTRLIIVFTDTNNPLLRKPVANLRVFDRELEEAVPLDDTGATSLTAVDSIAIPLRIASGFTGLSFVRTLNGNANADAIDFNYTVGEEYINRACGFRAVYTDLTGQLLPENPPAPWIRNLIVRNSNVVSNQDIHVEIRH